jgi:hypothetical protein
MLYGCHTLVHLLSDAFFCGEFGPYLPSILSHIVTLGSNLNAEFFVPQKMHQNWEEPTDEKLTMPKFGDIMHNNSSCPP